MVKLGVYLGIWEYLYNSNFKSLEFEGFKNEAGANAFTLSPQKWKNIYIGKWEILFNPHFNYTEFGTIKNEHFTGC
jgi:hypothetical protein